MQKGGPKDLIRKRPQQQRAIEKQCRILDTAQKLIFERGFAEATISEIAKAAGVNPPTIYQLFASRNGILTALIERRSCLINAANTEYFERAIPLGWRKAAAAGPWAFYETNRRDPSLDSIFTASQTFPELRELDRVQQRERARGFAELFSRLTGLPNDIAMEELCLTSTVMSASVVRHALLYDDQTGRRLVQNYIDFVIAYLESRGVT